MPVRVLVIYAAVMDFIVLHSDIVDGDSPGVFGPVFEQRGPPDFLFIFDMFWVMAEMHHSARSR